MSTAERSRKLKAQLRTLEGVFVSDLFAALHRGSTDDPASQPPNPNFQLDPLDAEKLQRQGSDIGKLRQVIGSGEPFFPLERYLKCQQMQSTKYLPQHAAGA